ncbi:hypothetical protein Efla_000014 [Eimeria flavescens]
MSGFRSGLLLLLLLLLLLADFKASVFGAAASRSLQQHQQQHLWCSTYSAAARRSALLACAAFISPVCCCFRVGWGPQGGAPPKPGLEGGPGEGPLFAVPKKRTSHSKTRSRRANWVRRQPRNHYKFSSVDVIGPHLSGGFALTAGRTAAANWLGAAGFLSSSFLLLKAAANSAAADAAPPLQQQQGPPDDPEKGNLQAS